MSVNCAPVETRDEDQNQLVQSFQFTYRDCATISWLSALFGLELMRHIGPAITFTEYRIPPSIGLNPIVSYNEPYCSNVYKKSCWLLPVCIGAAAGISWSFIRRKPPVRINGNTSLKTVGWQGLRHGLIHGAVLIPVVSLGLCCASNIYYINKREFWNHVSEMISDRLRYYKRA